MACASGGHFKHGLKKSCGRAVPATSNALIIFLAQVSTASVVYLELQAHKEGFAKVVLYENDLCEARSVPAPFVWFKHLLMVLHSWLHLCHGSNTF